MTEGRRGRGDEERSRVRRVVRVESVKGSGFFKSVGRSIGGRSLQKVIGSPRGEKETCTKVRTR